MCSIILVVRSEGHFTQFLKKKDRLLNQLIRITILIVNCWRGLVKKQSIRSSGYHPLNYFKYVFIKLFYRKVTTNLSQYYICVSNKFADFEQNQNFVEMQFRKWKTFFNADKNVFALFVYIKTLRSLSDK